MLSTVHTPTPSASAKETKSNMYNTNRFIFFKLQILLVWILRLRNYVAALRMTHSTFLITHLTFHIHT